MDIASIPMNKGFMYLAAIIDWYSKYVVSYELNDTLEIGVMLSACEKALKKSVPEIMNSDQGRHFTSEKISGFIFEEKVFNFNGICIFFHYLNLSESASNFV